MFPSSVSAFIFEYIDSVEQLEVLLLLSGALNRTWTAEELSRELRSNPNSIAQRLQPLCHSGLVVCIDQEYRYAPKDAALDVVVRELALANKTHRHRVLELIFSPLKKARMFADAFRLGRKEDGDDNG